MNNGGGGGRKRPTTALSGGGGGPPVRRRVTVSVTPIAAAATAAVVSGYGLKHAGPWELANGLHVRRCPENSDGEYTHYLVKPRNLDDLVSLSEFVATVPFSNNLNPAVLIKLRDPLQRLLNMVGLADVKASVFELVVYHLQRLHSLEGDLLHTAVYGSPGVGKTMLIGILAEVYSALGVVRADGPVVHARRVDLIGGYLGQTAIKTNDIIRSAHGGILVIDEAYALGQEEGGRDIYAAECVNALNQALTEQRSSFVCIIAGYKDAIESCFFRINPGLERRFTQRFQLPDCDAPALARIFRCKVASAGWTLESPEVGNDAFWTEHKRYFTFNGGDVESFFARVKMAHAVRVFSLPRREKRCVNKADLDTGFEAYRSMENVKRRGEEENMSHLMMYM